MNEQAKRAALYTLAVVAAIIALVSASSRVQAQPVPSAIGASCACNERVCCCAAAGQFIKMTCNDGWSR